MASASYFETKTPCVQTKVEDLTKWVESIQDDSDESDIGYFTCDGTAFLDDRDIAKCAIAITKANAKKGFVSLCTYIARILKQNAKLRKKLQHLRVRLKDAEVHELVGKSGTPTYSKPDSGSQQQDSQPQSLSLNDITAENNLPKAEKTRNADKAIDSNKANESLASLQPGSSKSKKNVIVTQAVVHHSAQSPGQYEEFSFGENAALSEHFATAEKSASVDETEPQEDHMSELLLSKSPNSCPEKMFPRVLRGANKSRSPSGNLSPSSGSPRLTNIYEGLPLDLSSLNVLSIDEPVEHTSEARCIKDCCKVTRRDTGEGCECSRQWIDKYSEMSQRFKKIEQELETLRQQLRSPRNLNRHPKELPAEKTSSNNRVEEHQPSSESTAKEEQMGGDSEPNWRNQLVRQNLTPLMAPTPLKGCTCSMCELEVQKLVLKAKDEDEIEVFELVSKGKPLLEVSALVMIPGNTIARVAYVGHLDSTDMPAAVFVGVVVDEPIGNCDGSNGGKRYFECEPKHGIFMPINQILFVVRHATDTMEDTKKKVPLRRKRSHSHPGRLQHRC